jgi:hypothetical protein
MAVTVRCASTGDDHRCEVEVMEGTSVTHHTVLVRRGDRDRWGMGRSVEDLVRDSFDFLLKRESQESILPEFELSVIARFFPDYERAIRRSV